MRVPIQYALTYPKREEGILEPFDFFHHNTLQFFPPDRKRFTCLALAEEALKVGKSLPCLMNAANEVLVQRFLQGEIGWMDIGRKLETVMEQHAVQEVSSIEAVVAIDQQARNSALRI